MSLDIENDELEGIDTKEPAFGLPAKWINGEMKDEAELLGYTVVDPPSVVSTHLTEVIKQHAHVLLGRQETQELVDHLKETYPILVEEVTPEQIGRASCRERKKQAAYERHVQRKEEGQ